MRMLVFSLGWIVLLSGCTPRTGGTRSTAQGKQEALPELQENAGTDEGDQENAGTDEGDKSKNRWDHVDFDLLLQQAELYDDVGRSGSRVYIRPPYIKWSDNYKSLCSPFVPMGNFSLIQCNTTNKSDTHPRLDLYEEGARVLVDIEVVDGKPIRLFVTSIGKTSIFFDNHQPTGGKEVDVIELREGDDDTYLRFRLGRFSTFPALPDIDTPLEGRDGKNYQGESRGDGEYSRSYRIRRVGNSWMLGFRIRNVKTTADEAIFEHFGVDMTADEITQLRNEEILRQQESKSK